MRSDFLEVYEHGGIDIPFIVQECTSYALGEIMPFLSSFEEVEAVVVY